MSKQNKANKDNYVQAGRLTADDLAREQRKQQLVAGSAAERQNQGGRAKASKPAAPRGRKGTSARKTAATGR